ncbi:MAG: hypothetical protein ABIP35_07340 [Ginsengibacter sp.]
MKKILSNSLLLFFLCSYFAISCSDANKKKESSTTATITNLKDYNAELPEAPGSKVYYANCVICHSASYVQNQPALTEKAWLGIVTKMRKTFGAPVADSSIEPIVKYLVAIKGKS